MKTCAYCNSRNDDHAKNCEKCGAVELRNVCNNCQTIFSSGFCPTCGVRAGEIAKLCSNCGTQSFSTFCPTCGFRVGASATATEKSYARSSTVYIKQTPQKSKGEKNRKQSNGKMIVLTLLLLPIFSWIILFSKKYNKKMRVFVIVLSIVMIIQMLILSLTEFRDPTEFAGLLGMIGSLILLILPLIAYGIKLLVVRSKDKPKIEINS